MKVKVKKPKTVNVQLIARDSDAPTYAMMDKLVVEHHEHLAEAQIALAWNLNWSADPDGRLILGKCKRVGDLDRQLHGFDFVILLNKDAWEHPEFDDKMKRGLLDHELCHAQVKRDEDDNLVMDETGKICYRVKKHDLEEFREIVARHGIWKDDIRAFIATALHAARDKKQSPLIAQMEEKTGT